jgi:hypothetical protein
MPDIDPGVDAGNLAQELTRLRMFESEASETDYLFVSVLQTNISDTGNVSRISRQIDEIVRAAVGEEEPTAPLTAMFPTQWFVKSYRSPGPATSHQELSYLLGIALGRWDIRIPLGLTGDPPLPPSPYGPLPSTSRGMLIGEGGLPTFIPPADYPVNLPPKGILHDEPGHLHDVVSSIEDVIECLMSTSERPVLRIHQYVTDLRRHLRRHFFVGHLKDYSASRRYAPIYWYLTVPSKEWGLWVYAPALSREMLFAIAGAARDKLRRTHEQVAQLLGRHSDSTDRDTTERIERAERLADEIEPFAEHADKVAQSGWQPDLDDGMVLCAAPLEPLFAEDAWRKRVSQHQKDLEQNKYPWASVQREYYGGGV